MRPCILNYSDVADCCPRPIPISHNGLSQAKSPNTVWSFSHYVGYSCKMSPDIGSTCTQSVVPVYQIIETLCKYTAEASFIVLRSCRVAPLSPTTSSEDKRPTVSPMGSPQSSAIRLCDDCTTDRTGNPTAVLPGSSLNARNILSVHARHVRITLDIPGSFAYIMV